MDDLFRLSHLAGRMQPSPIRELFKLIAQPELISFAGGLPDPGAFPVDRVASCADVLNTNGLELLQYGASEGFGPLRDILLDMSGRRLGYSVSGAELLVTSGSQQAVDLVGRALLDPGDVVVVEAPTYPGTLHSLRNVGARFVAVACDSEGMRVDRLPKAVARCERDTGRRPKLIYTVPDFSNPSGACLSLQRRSQLLSFAQELRIPILEDDPYGCLRYRGESLPSIKSLAGDSPTVIYCSSFSKILAPGVRVAWAVADPELIRTMVLVRQGEDLCTSTVTQGLVAEYCRRGYLEDHLEKILAIYSAKCSAMELALAKHLPQGSASWHVPAGGFFFWLLLDGISSRDLFHRAIGERVAFVPGEAFYPDVDEQIGDTVTGDRFARLCFTFADTQQIDEGCRRLSRALSPAPTAG